MEVSEVTGRAAEHDVPDVQAGQQRLDQVLPFLRHQRLDPARGQGRGQNGAVDDRGGAQAGAVKGRGDQSEIGAGQRLGVGGLEEVATGGTAEARQPQA